MGKRAKSWYFVVLLPLLLAACGPTPAPSTTSPDTAATSAFTRNTAAGTDTVALTPDGLAGFPFGANKTDVSAFLQQVLGAPDAPIDPGSVGQCEGGAGLWGTHDTYGPLTVAYYATDASPKSPQLLASWSLSPYAAPKPPLVLSPDIPLGLTLDQLKAKYPNGGGLENVGAWFTGTAIIVPEQTDGTSGIFVGLLDWCT